jgi:hypothetical protein
MNQRSAQSALHVLVDLFAHGDWLRRYTLPSNKDSTKKHHRQTPSSWCAAAAPPRSAAAQQAAKNALGQDGRGGAEFLKLKSSASGKDERLRADRSLNSPFHFLNSVSVGLEYSMFCNIEQDSAYTSF